MFQPNQEVSYRGTCYRINKQMPDGRWHIRARRRACGMPGFTVVQAFDLSPWVQPAAKARSGAICQCCGRQIEAKRGNIAHHGYQRPGQGWQTSSCIGAMFPPFQVSRDRLGYLIDQVIKPYVVRCEGH